MNDAPEAVVSYLDALEIECELNGYLCLHNDEKIVFGAGMIGEFNLSELDKTISVVLSVPLLEGLLPAKQNSVTVIRNVHIEDNQYFDIHLLNDDTGYWVLFIDATRSGKQLQEEQQVRLDVDLINDKRKTGS